MALTSKEKHEIVHFLGWTGKVLIQSSTHYNSIVNSRLENLNVDIERIARGLLERLRAIVAQMDEARCRLSATKVGNVDLNKEEIDELRCEYKKWIYELSDLLDISVQRRSGGVNIGVVV